MSYPQIDIAGTPREMGVSHGRQLKNRIQKTAAAMRRLIGEDAYDATWDVFQPALFYGRETAPALIEEMEGIALGADIEFRHVFQVNAHLDLSVWKKCVAKVDSDDSGCSSHAVSTGTGVLLGWNGDDRKCWLDCGAVIRGRPVNGIPFIYWSLAGSVGRPGMNRYLGLGANSLPARDWRSDGLLYPMLSRLLLGCRNVDEGIRMIEKHNRCSPMNYLLVDKNGSMADLEVETNRFATLRPGNEDCYLLHTNCYLDEELAKQAVDSDSACPRLAAARRLYRQKVPENVADVRAIQADHSGGVCVHREETGTIVSFVAEIGEQRFHIIHGNPCDGTPVTYELLS